VYASLKDNPKITGLPDYDLRLLLDVWIHASENRREPGVVGHTRRRGFTLEEFASLVAPFMGTDELNASGQIQVIREPRASAARLAPALLRLQSAGLIAVLRAGADPSPWLSGAHSARAEREIRQDDLLLEERRFAGTRFQIAVVNWRERQWLEKRHRKPSDSRDRVRERVRRHREKRRQEAARRDVDPLDRALAEAVGAVDNPVDKPRVTPTVTPLETPVTPLPPREKRPSNAPVTTSFGREQTLSRPATAPQTPVQARVSAHVTTPRRESAAGVTTQSIQITDTNTPPTPPTDVTTQFSVTTLNGQLPNGQLPNGQLPNGRPSRSSGGSAHGRLVHIRDVLTRLVPEKLA